MNIKQGSDLVKKILYIFLVMSILSGLVLSISCTHKDLMEWPYGQVMQKTKDARFDLIKDHNGSLVDFSQIPPDYGFGEYFIAVDLQVRVWNAGGPGILTFLAEYNGDSTLGKKSYTQNITLIKDREGELVFRFWVDMQELSKPEKYTFSVQYIDY